MSVVHSDRGDIRIAVVVVAAVLLLPVLLLGAAAGFLTQQAQACQAQPAPSGQATSIPAAYLTWYRTAGQQYRIPWEVLAGIGEVESGHGRSAASGVHSGANAAGAAGPMQIGIGRGWQHLGRRTDPPC